MLHHVAKESQPATAHDTIHTGGNGAAPISEFEPYSDGEAELLEKIGVGTQSIDSYVSIIGEEKVDELKSLAAKLNGARVLHINATAYGGGVAELLRSHIPLLRSLGVDAEWMIIRGDEPFFNITKAFHNALQGGVYDLSAGDREIYLANNSRNARYLTGDYDYIVVHDPQPAALRLLFGGNGTKWVWRCHIDTSEPNPGVWEFLKPYVDAYDAVVYTMEQYVASDLPKEKVSVMPPAIDPLSPKNIQLPKELCKKNRWLGRYCDRPAAHHSGIPL